MLRVVNLERLKKLYATFSIPQLLTEYKIGDNELMPISEDSDVTLKDDEHFTPLWYYDDTEFDSRNADEWVKKDNNGVNLPVPAIVYLPTDSNKEFSKNYNWTNANVIDYNSTLKMYSVVVSFNDSTNVYSEIPRIQIHFKGEDPREFVKRIKYAILRREYCENIYKWSIYINNVLLDKRSKYISESLPDDTVKRILHLLLKNQKIKKMNTDQINIIVEQLNNIYEESCLSFRLQLLKSISKEHHNTLKIPNFDFEQFIRKPGTAYAIDAQSTLMDKQLFMNMREEFNRRNLLELPEVYTSLCEANVEITLIKNIQLLLTDFKIYLTLDEFEKAQLKNIFETFNLLKNSWIKEIAYKCYAVLVNIKTGWFDISTSKIKIYESSINKLRRLMTLITHMMEERLRLIVLNSTKAYTRLIEQPTIPMKGINDDFTWGNNLNKSPFDECAPPLFSITLSMNENGAFYSINPDKFEMVIISLLKRMILESHEIPAIHPCVLANLTFLEKPYLISIGLIEPEIVDFQATIENSIRLAIIPIKAYCKEYNIHLHLYNINVESYVKKFFEGNPSLNKIKEEISMQITMKLNLEKTFPENITIGLFFINVEFLKNLLIKKRIELADLIMNTHASLTTEKIEICCAEYNRMYLKLIEVPTTAEQVFEIKEWINDLPNLISDQTEILKLLLKEMDMLDAFLWILEDEQLKLKYSSLIWPYKINLKVKESLENIAIYIEKFEKIQIEDELLLQENVEYLSDIILKLTIENNLSKVNEIAVEVNKNWKLIKDLQLTSQTLNLRQKLFGHTVTPFENVEHLVDEFEPYKILWQSASEFFKLQSAWMQNPLINIKKSTVEPTLNNLLNIVTKCVEQFAEIPGTLSVANEIKTQIEEYIPMVHLLNYILTQGMKQRHWDIFADITGIKIILSPTLTFKKCLALGISDHIEEIKQLSDNASKEYIIEIALNKMMDEWTGVKFQLLPYNDEDIYISTITSTEFQMLDDHILLTRQLSSSSFKGIFEEPLAKWEEDLRLSKDVLNEWREFQKRWLYLKPIFDNPDIKEQLPVENKKLSLVERIWKRIMKITLNKPWYVPITTLDLERLFSMDKNILLDIRVSFIFTTANLGKYMIMKTCPDKQLLDQLINGNVQLMKVQKALELSG